MVPFRQAQGPERVEGQWGQRTEDTKNAAILTRRTRSPAQFWSPISTSVIPHQRRH